MITNIGEDYFLFIAYALKQIQFVMKIYILCMKILETGYMFQDWSAVPQVNHIRLIPARDKFNKYLNSQRRSDVGAMHFVQLCLGAKPLSYNHWRFILVGKFGIIVITINKFSVRWMRSKLFLGKYWPLCPGLKWPLLRLHRWSLGMNK